MQNHNNRLRPTRLAAALGVAAIAIGWGLPAAAADGFEATVPDRFDHWPRAGDIRAIASQPVYADIAALRAGGMPLLAWVTGNSLASRGAFAGLSAPAAPVRIAGNLQIANSHTAGGGDAGSATPDAAPPTGPSGGGSVSFFFYFTIAMPLMEKFEAKVARDAAADRRIAADDYAIRQRSEIGQQGPGIGEDLVSQVPWGGTVMDIAMPNGEAVQVYPDSEGTGFFTVFPGGEITHTMSEPLTDDQMPATDDRDTSTTPKIGTEPQQPVDEPVAGNKEDGCTGSDCTEGTAPLPATAGTCTGPECTEGAAPPPVTTDRTCGYAECGVFILTTYGSVGAAPQQGDIPNPDLGYGGNLVNAVFNATIIPVSPAGLSPQQLLAGGIDTTPAGTDSEHDPFVNEAVIQAVANNALNLAGFGGVAAAGANSVMVPFNGLLATFNTTPGAWTISLGGDAAWEGGVRINFVDVGGGVQPLSFAVAVNLNSGDYVLAQIDPLGLNNGAMATITFQGPDGVKQIATIDPNGNSVDGESHTP